MARDRDDLGAGRAAHAELGVLGAAHANDVGHRRERLDVVDQRRALVEALDGRERRLQPRVAALALERVEQSGLLAADVGAGAAVQHQRAGEVAAKDVLADVARGGGLRQRRVEDPRLRLVLAADVDEGVIDAGAVCGDHDPLDQHVRALLQQLAVLEGARLGLVGVTDQVTVHVSLRQERGLAPGGEAGAAAAAQPGGIEFGDDRRRLHREGLAHRLIAAAALVDLERGKSRLVDVCQQDRGRAHQALALGSALRRRASARSGIGSRPARRSSIRRCASAGSSGP